MEKVLPKLAHSDQTGFVNRRYIGQNIRFLNDIMNILADFEKGICHHRMEFYIKNP